MTILDIDMGNTRLKWRVSGVGEESLSGVCGYAEASSADEIFIAIPRSVTLDRARIACVAKQERLESVCELVAARWSIVAEVAQVERICAGLTQSYEDETLLGVDRWLMMLAAYNQQNEKSAVMIVGCGTAITIDLVNADGEHLGGFIVPGLQLMRSSLYTGTKAVKLEHLEWPEQLRPGKSTQAAVENGILLMAKSAIENASLLMRERGGSFQQIICGGDGELISRHLPFSCAYRPHLVLDGLGWALP